MRIWPTRPSEPAPPPNVATLLDFGKAKPGPEEERPEGAYDLRTRGRSEGNETREPVLGKDDAAAAQVCRSRRGSNPRPPE